MKFFRKKNSALPQTVMVSEHSPDNSDLFFSKLHVEHSLYNALRYKVPVIDAAISKIVRLTGGYKVICSDKSMQSELDDFVYNVPVGLTGKSLFTFTDVYFDSLLTYGNAVGEFLIDEDTSQIAALYNANVSDIEVKQGDSPCQRLYFKKISEKEKVLLPFPERILFSALNPACGEFYGNSILRGLPSLSRVLLRIYDCIDKNYERMGNVRYAVTYRPSSESADAALSKERAMQIANEWADGMKSSKFGEVRDFVAVGNVEIKAIGADSQMLDTEIPVRQIMEQIVSKLCIPPFLLGLNWSSTERMSVQQADILTSELEYYRRILNPVITDICTAFLRLAGSDAEVSVEWDNINLQDEAELAEARLKNAQALEIEMRISSEYGI